MISSRGDCMLNDSERSKELTDFLKADDSDHAVISMVNGNLCDISAVIYELGEK